MTIQDMPELEEIKTGWAARGSGWAVHAETKERAIEKYERRKKFYQELEKRIAESKVENKIDD